jgi:TM2 domain-containing membrane protein YozV
VTGVMIELILFALIVWFVVLPILMWVVIGFGMALNEIFEAFQPNSPFVRPDEMVNPNLPVKESWK